jgi:hypothetical protein
MRDFVDKREGEHECTTELLGLAWGRDGVGVEDTKEAGGHVDQSVCAVEIEGYEGVVRGLGLGIVVQLGWCREELRYIVVRRCEAGGGVLGWACALRVGPTEGEAGVGGHLEVDVGS